MAERVSRTKRVQEVVQGTSAYPAMGVGVCARAPCNHKGVEFTKNCNFTNGRKYA